MKEKIVIIGGGVAGLTAGIYAQKAGFESAIYEKNPVLGGQCAGWKRKGFYIDNCITWLTNGAPKFPVYKMWKEVGFLGDENGNEIPCRQHDAFWTSELDGQSYTFWADLERAEKEMLLLSPQDKKEIKAFFKAVRMCEHLRVPYEAPLDMMNLFQLAKIGISMIPVGLAMMKYRTKDLSDLAARFKHPLLKKAFTDYLPKEYLASILMNAYGSISNGGGDVPDGGSLKTAQRMEAIYKKLGGKCFASSPVKEILLEDSPNKKGKKRATGILLENGEKVFADYIIPSCDPHYLFENILDKKYMPPRLKFAYDNPDAHRKGSTFHVAYECDGPANEIGRRTFFDCRPFELAGVTVSRINMKNYNKDPVNAPAGKALIEVKVLEKEEQFLYWQKLRQEDKAAYDAAKQKAAADILERLEERVPSLRGKMKYLDAWTPYTYTRYCNAYYGCFMSFITTKKSSNLFNISGKLKEIENVVLAGQWLSMPGGLPMAMTSGKFAVQRILRSQGKSIKIEP